MKVLKFIECKNITEDDNGSEWINIDLPAKTHLFEINDLLYNKNKVYFKRILSHTGEVVWRHGLNNNINSWITIKGVNHNINETHFNIYLREEKLKRIIP